MLSSAFFAMVMGFSVTPAAARLGDDSFITLKRTLGDAFQEPESRLPTLKYCPDNTCDVFRTKKGSRQDLADFALLYLFFFSYYTYLGEWRERVGRASVENAARRHRGDCPAVMEAQAVRCVLMRLATGRSISLAWVRYDEGKEVESAIRLDEALRVPR